MKLYQNWIINEVARAGEHTNERTYVRTYSHTYVRDRPYIPSTTLLCEGIIIVSDQSGITSYCSYAQSAQPGPIRTRLWGPCIAVIAGYLLISMNILQTYFCINFLYISTPITANYWSLKVNFLGPENLL